MASEQGKDVVDLLQIDWSKPETGMALNVCLFRIFTSLDSPDLIERWLAEHGFEVVLLQQISDPKENNPYRHVKAINGAWTPDQYYAHRPSFLYRITGFTFLTSAGMTIGLTIEDEVVGAEMFLNSK